MSLSSPSKFYNQDIPLFRYMIKTEGKKETIDGEGPSVGEKNHISGHGHKVDAKAASPNISDFSEPGSDYSSTNAGVHFNGNDYLTYQNLPDYLAHLNKFNEVNTTTYEVDLVGKPTHKSDPKGKNGRRDKVAKNTGKHLNTDFLTHLKDHLGSKTEHLNTNVDKIDVKRGRIQKADEQVEKVRTDKLDVARKEAKRKGKKDDKNHLGHNDLNDNSQHMKDIKGDDIEHAIPTTDNIDLKKVHVKKADLKVKKKRNRKKGKDYIAANLLDYLDHIQDKMGSGTEHMNTTTDKKAGNGGKAGNKADKEVINVRRNKEFIPHSHNSDYVNVPTDTFNMKRKQTKEVENGVENVIRHEEFIPYLLPMTPERRDVSEREPMLVGPFEDPERKGVIERGPILVGPHEDPTETDKPRNHTGSEVPKFFEILDIPQNNTGVETLTNHTKQEVGERDKNESCTDKNVTKIYNHEEEIANMVADKNWTEIGSAEEEVFEDRSELPILSVGALRPRNDPHWDTAD